MEKKKMIEEIHARIGELYAKYGYPALSVELHPDLIHIWAGRVAVRLGLDPESYGKTCSELFWTVSHIQLSIGYALISREGSSHPRGARGEVYEFQDTPGVMGLPEQHFWHHMYHCYECIYRSWERITEIIRVACKFPDDERLYFDGLLDRLGKDPQHSESVHLPKLQSQVKHWNIIARERNLRSHKTSSSLHALQYEYASSGVLGPRGEALRKIRYRTIDLTRELDTARDRYMRLKPAIVSMQRFIDAI